MEYHLTVAENYKKSIFSNNEIMYRNFLLKNIKQINFSFQNYCPSTILYDSSFVQFFINVYTFNENSKIKHNTEIPLIRTIHFSLKTALQS